MLNIEVTVKRQDIIEKLKANKAKHQAEYAEAVEGYLEKKYSSLAKLFQEYRGGWTIENDFVVRENFGLQKPVDNSEKYDELINSFELISEEDIDISFNDAKSIANDSFQWVESAKFINSLYSNAR